MHCYIVKGMDSGEILGVFATQNLAVESVRETYSAQGKIVITEITAHYCRIIIPNGDALRIITSEVHQSIQKLA